MPRWSELSNKFEPVWNNFTDWLDKEWYWAVPLFVVVIIVLLIMNGDSEEEH